MDQASRKLADMLLERYRLATMPVAVKLAAEGDQPPDRIKYPRKALGHELAVCQGMSLARTLGWSMGFEQKDHGCPLPRIFMGHDDPKKFLQGDIASPYQADPACRATMEAGYPRWPLGRYQQVWLAPLNQCEFLPDLAVVYGSPAQILALVQGANFGVGTGIKSVSTGRYGCSLWLAGALQNGECTFMIPGPGERIFAGTQDHEMSFAIPYAKFEQLIEGLEYVGGKGSYRYPVPNMGMMAVPAIPKKYFDILGD